MLEAIKFGLLVQALLFLLKTSQGNEETLLPKEQVIFIYPSKVNYWYFDLKTILY